MLYIEGVGDRVARSTLAVGRRLVAVRTHVGYDSTVGSVRVRRRFRDEIQQFTFLWHMSLSDEKNKHLIPVIFVKLKVTRN